MCKIGEFSNTVKCPDCDIFSLERLSLKKAHKQNLSKNKYIPYENQEKRFACINCGREWITLKNSFLNIVELEEVVE